MDQQLTGEQITEILDKVVGSTETICVGQIEPSSLSLECTTKKLGELTLPKVPPRGKSQPITEIAKSLNHYDKLGAQTEKMVKEYDGKLRHAANNVRKASLNSRTSGDTTSLNLATHKLSAIVDEMSNAYEGAVDDIEKAKKSLENKLKTAIAGLSYSSRKEKFSQSKALMRVDTIVNGSDLTIDNSADEVISMILDHKQGLISGAEQIQIDAQETAKEILSIRRQTHGTSKVEMHKTSGRNCNPTGSTARDRQESRKKVMDLIMQGNGSAESLKELLSKRGPKTTCKKY